jgi:hypothetical protein
MGEVGGRLIPGFAHNNSPSGLIGKQLQSSREAVVATVTGSRAAVRHRSGDADFPAADIDCAVAIDAFAFAMKVERQAGRLVARRFTPGALGDEA